MLGAQCLFACGGQAGSRPSKPPASSVNLAQHDARAVLQRMRERYASTPTYRDTGVLRNVIRRPERAPLRSMLTFRTAFDRASQGFYFEFIELQDRFFDPSRAVVWQLGASPAKTWWTTRAGEVEELPLKTALGGFAGVSSRTSWLVPSLLLGYEAGFKASYRFVESTSIEEAPAAHLTWRQG